VISWFGLYEATERDTGYARYAIAGDSRVSPITRNHDGRNGFRWPRQGIVAFVQHR
jgi:hypothetical protein